ncbi:MAG: tetratricopeptide repeat protein, partial [Myxococcota bacterium]
MKTANRGTRKRTNRGIPVALAVCALLPGLAASAQDTGNAEALNAEVVRLNGQGRYDEAIPLAERLLAINEKDLGPEHHDVATSLNNLAALYRTKGDY